MSAAANSAEWDIFDPARAARAQARQERVAALLDARGLDAALLTDPANLAWVGCGADLTGGLGRGGLGPGGTAVFLTRSSRVLACSSADAPHLFDREIPGLGFQLKQRPWFEPPGELFSDLCRGRAVGVDAPPARPSGEADGDDPADLRAPLADFRGVLDDGERAALAGLGADVAHAVEAVCRGATAGRTECDLAGELAHRLLRRGAAPAFVRVAGDGRGDAQPHYAAGRRPVLTRATLAAVGRRDGLHAHCARTILFRENTARADRDDYRAHHRRALLVQAAGLHFSRAGAAWADVWPKAARIYEKTGPADDWRAAPVVLRTGFAPVEAAPGPSARFALEPGTPLVWQPRCGPAACGDTALVAETGPAAVLTGMEDWPRVAVAVKGVEYERPGALVL